MDIRASAEPLSVNDLRGVQPIDVVAAEDSIHEYHTRSGAGMRNAGLLGNEPFEDSFENRNLARLRLDEGLSRMEARDVVVVHQLDFEVFRRETRQVLSDRSEI